MATGILRSTQNPPTLLGAVSILGSVLLSGLTYTLEQPEIPLWYSLAVPEQQLERKIGIFVFPLSLLLIVVFHRFLSMAVMKNDKHIASLIEWSLLIPVTLLLIAQIRIMAAVL